MPDPENKTVETNKDARAPRRYPPQSVMRDEAIQYGDEADISIRRGRSDAKTQQGRQKPKPNKAKPIIPKAAKGKKQKKPRYNSLFEWMNALGSGRASGSFPVFGIKLHFWPLFMLGIVAFIGVGVMLNNSNLKVREQTVTVVGLPEDLENYRIVVMSDMNGRRFGDSQSLLLRTINGLNYDAIFCLGDMVGKGGNAEPFYEFLEGLRRPERVYFICGDSDPGPYVQTPRNITGTLSQIVLEDWILGAIERGANYVDAPMQITVRNATLWISPATMLNLETVSTMEAWKDQAEQEADGVLYGITEDYNSLPRTDYRYQTIQKLYQAERSMTITDIHISLAHEVPAEAFIYTSQDHDLTGERFLYSPELILAGHYCNGVWRLPFGGAFYVPDKTLPRGGWFPDQSKIYGLSSVDDTQIYITGGMSTNSAVPLMPFRLFNGPEITLLTLTSTLPENMLEAGQ